MGAYATVIATAMAQLRNAYLSCIVNKNDPYNAISILQFMTALLPETARPDLAEAPKQSEDFLSDPDKFRESKDVWLYLRRAGFLVEESASKYIYNQMSRLRS